MNGGKANRNSTGKLKKLLDIEQCGLDYAFGRMGGKYKGRLILKLKDGPLRYGELKRQVIGIMPKMLTQVLRDLELDGLITRKDYEEVPPRVEYKLTPDALRLIPLLQMLSDWGKDKLAKRASSFIRKD